MQFSKFSNSRKAKSLSAYVAETTCKAEMLRKIASQNIWNWCSSNNMHDTIAT